MYRLNVFRICEQSENNAIDLLEWLKKYNRHSSTLRRNFVDILFFQFYLTDLWGN